MNIEQIEFELTQLKGKLVYVIVPISIEASFSLASELQVVETKEHSVGFHLSTVGVALIFFAMDVETLEDPLTQSFTKTIRLKKSLPKA